MACFVAHHAAETALKSVLQSLKTDARGRSLINLCHALSMQFALSPGIMNASKRLDGRSAFNHPAEPVSYSKEDAEQALKDAEQIITFCERLER